MCENNLGHLSTSCLLFYLLSSLYKKSSFEMTNPIFVLFFLLVTVYKTNLLCSVHGNTHSILLNEVLPDSRLRTKAN
jgi:hypothetical protein